MDSLEEFLFALVILEGAVCLACAYMVLLVSPLGIHHYYMITHLSLFVGAALLLVLTTAVADCYRLLRRRHSRHS
jgi:hypothetical protein